MTALSCPFCGREADIKRLDTTADPWWYVQCRYCYAKSGEWRPESRAIEQWNTRLPLTSPFADGLLITEDWLKSVGFRWDQFDRQPNKHWTLWLGHCLDCPANPGMPRRIWRFSSDEDFAIELGYNLAPGRLAKNADDDFWFCFFRSDTAGRYHRFIHVRHLRFQREVRELVVALTGRPWNPDNHIYGSVRCEECAERALETDKRIDREWMRRFPWYDAEKDLTRGGATPEHLSEHIKRGVQG